MVIHQDQDLCSQSRVYSQSLASELFYTHSTLREYLGVVRPNGMRKTSADLAEDVVQGGVLLDERRPVDLVALHERVEAEDATCTERGDSEEDQHVHEVAVDEAVGHVPVPEVEQQHHEGPEERREAGQEANHETQADGDFTVRDDNVHDIDEPRRLAHPEEHPLQGVAVGRGDVSQVSRGAETVENLVEPRVEERKADDETERKHEPRAETVSLPGDGEATDPTLERVGSVDGHLIHLTNRETTAKRI